MTPTNTPRDSSSPGASSLGSGDSPEPPLTHSEPPAALSVWTTLRLATFRSFWIAGLFSLIGSWMQNIGSAWLMTDLSDSPILVASVQAS